ncbi:hypothetical protein COCC4DRAFT_42123 [Bipolaris maydis ATCC 48331]|uniref:Uncharacterized protein n=1 Tax=Cochliobolus heterostrophus (strain C4 / ATCC 48331 / race T) TaxID=665024 RepID=N4WU84_COCH4|nr:uncharacterized protein COCC4DRAFT_42123 [Bipolaris maydis ATCC 48331]ENI03020.1 hypothetical protein COCC4DRAFT_42123 [Bipolaris maydis ATCC 48331]
MDFISFRSVKCFLIFICILGKDIMKLKSRIREDSKKVRKHMALSWDTHSSSL